MMGSTTATVETREDERVGNLHDAPKQTIRSATAILKVGCQMLSPRV